MYKRYIGKKSTFRHIRMILNKDTIFLGCIFGIKNLYLVYGL